jgi:trans-2,3-dihydro-3-hydroxyanthranilate isomerase
MTDYRFRILNVFTLPGDRLSGNPLAVLENGAGLTDDQMRALARQFNLSETTFILEPTAAAKEQGASARVRIFTPSFEMPFAGHPTLGTAHVVRDLLSCGDRVNLDMKAGLIEVTADGDAWTLRTNGTLATRAPDATREELAATLGVSVDSVGDVPLWVDTGAEQLVVPLASVDAVCSARPNAALLARHGFSEKRGASMAYIWAKAGADQVITRFFFVANGGVVEDPATGSACANLGGWMLATGKPLPLRLDVRQGDAVGRPSRLQLHVDEASHIFVSGQVTELGRGTLALA